MRISQSRARELAPEPRQIGLDSWATREAGGNGTFYTHSLNLLRVTPTMPERRPLHALPIPAGMDPEQRMKLAIELTEQAVACMNDQPAEGAGML